MYTTLFKPLLSQFHPGVLECLPVLPMFKHSTVVMHVCDSLYYHGIHLVRSSPLHTRYLAWVWVSTRHVCRLYLHCRVLNTAASSRSDLQKAAAMTGTHSYSNFAMFTKTMDCKYNLTIRATINAHKFCFPIDNSTYPGMRHLCPLHEIFSFNRLGQWPRTSPI